MNEWGCLLQLDVFRKNLCFQGCNFAQVCRNQTWLLPLQLLFDSMTEVASHRFPDSCWIYSPGFINKLFPNLMTTLDKKINFRTSRKLYLLVRWTSSFILLIRILCHNITLLLGLPNQALPVSNLDWTNHNIKPMEHSCIAAEVWSS